MDRVARVTWNSGTAAYIRNRPARYPGAMSIEPEWAVEAVRDVAAVFMEPDPKSRMGAIRVVGMSASAGRPLTVILARVGRTELVLINAWPASGADMHLYLEGEV